jgi:hypothetical protein
MVGSDHKPHSRSVVGRRRVEVCGVQVTTSQDDCSQPRQNGPLDPGRRSEDNGCRQRYHGRGSCSPTSAVPVIHCIELSGGSVGSALPGSPAGPAGGSGDVGSVCVADGSVSGGRVGSEVVEAVVGDAEVGLRVDPEGDCDTVGSRPACSSPHPTRTTMGRTAMGRQRSLRFIAPAHRYFRERSISKPLPVLRGSPGRRVCAAVSWEEMEQPSPDTLKRLSRPFVWSIASPAGFRTAFRTRQRRATLIIRQRAGHSRNRTNAVAEIHRGSAKDFQSDTCLHCQLHIVAADLAACAASR